MSGILKPLIEEPFRRGAGLFAWAAQTGHSGISGKGLRAANNLSASPPSPSSAKPGVQGSTDGLHTHQPSGAGKRVEKTESGSGGSKRRHPA